MDIDKLLKEKSAIELDIGCGASKHPGSVGIDILPLPGVDIVHDLEQTPWPLPDECVFRAYASHVLEHIDRHKGVFINVMNEIWRVMKPGGQFAFVVPYGGNALYYQDPTHVNPITETTIYYFDPDPEQKYAGQALYFFYQPKPWKIEQMYYDRNGLLECLLSKRKDDPSYHDKTPKDFIDQSRNVPKHVIR